MRISQDIEAGENKIQACINGTKEIGFTIVSMTLSLTAVFIPILFMSGILGKLLHELAVVITTAILLSGVISITVTPMLCNVFLKDEEKKRHCEEQSDEAISGQQNKIATQPMAARNDKVPLTEKAFEYIKQKYSNSLEVVAEYSKPPCLYSY